VRRTEVADEENKRTAAESVTGEKRYPDPTVSIGGGWVFRRTFGMRPTKAR
jgi:hypothetical protein